MSFGTHLLPHGVNRDRSPRAFPHSRSNQLHSYARKHSSARCDLSPKGPSRHTSSQTSPRTSIHPSSGCTLRTLCARTRWHFFFVMPWFIPTASPSPTRTSSGRHITLIQSGRPSPSILPRFMLIRCFQGSACSKPRLCSHPFRYQTPGDCRSPCSEHVRPLGSFPETTCPIHPCPFLHAGQ